MENVIKIGIDLAPKSKNYKIAGKFTEAMFAKDYEAWMRIFRAERIKAAESNKYSLITLWSGDYLYLYKKYNATDLTPIAFVKSENGTF